MKAAHTVPFTTAVSRQKNTHQVLADRRMKEERAREPGIDADEVCVRRKAARKKRRRWMAMKDADVMMRTKGKQAELKQLVCSGTPTDDRDAWEAELGRFVTERF